MENPYKNTMNLDAFEAWEIGKRQGRKEVVEEYRAVRACVHIVGYHYLKDCKECEQAKLKDWGIKEVE